MISVLLSPRNRSNTSDRWPTGVIVLKHQGSYIDLIVSIFDFGCRN